MTNTRSLCFRNENQPNITKHPVCIASVLRLYPVGADEGDTLVEGVVS